MCVYWGLGNFKKKKNKHLLSVVHVPLKLHRWIPKFLRCPWTQHDWSPVWGERVDGGRVSYLCSHWYTGFVRADPLQSMLQSGTHLFSPHPLLCCREAEPEQSWSQRSPVRHRSSSSSSGAARSDSLHPGPMSWLRCPGTSTPDTG